MNTHDSNTRTTSLSHRSLIHRARAALRRRFDVSAGHDAGMSTVEYAVGTIAAAAFGAVLYTVVSGDSIPDALGGIIEQALNPSV
jgi:hypothetical protein